MKTQKNSTADQEGSAPAHHASLRQIRLDRFDKYDWNSWAGAEAFGNNRGPYIGSVDVGSNDDYVAIIADKVGVAAAYSTLKRRSKRVAVFTTPNDNEVAILKVAEDFAQALAKVARTITCEKAFLDWVDAIRGVLGLVDGRQKRDEYTPPSYRIVLAHPGHRAYAGLCGGLISEEEALRLFVRVQRLALQIVLGDYGPRSTNVGSQYGFRKLAVEMAELEARAFPDALKFGMEVA